MMMQRPFALLRALSLSWACLFGLGFLAPVVAQTAAPARAAAAEYRLAAGDVVRITVYQNPDLTLETRIGESGVISYPLLGTVRLGGKTISEAEKSDGRRAAQRQLRQATAGQHAGGAGARQPGQRAGPGQQAGALSDRGGRYAPVRLAGHGRWYGIQRRRSLAVVGTRDGKPFRKEVDLPGLFRSDSREDDLVIKDGDVICVDRAPLVYIYGEVQRPGAMRLERDMTVMQALATGGGLNLRGTEKGMRSCTARRRRQDAGDPAQHGRQAARRRRGLRAREPVLSGGRS